ASRQTWGESIERMIPYSEAEVQCRSARLHISGVLRFCGNNRKDIGEASTICLHNSVTSVWESYSFIISSGLSYKRLAPASRAWISISVSLNCGWTESRTYGLSDNAPRYSSRLRCFSGTSGRYSLLALTTALETISVFLSGGSFSYQDISAKGAFAI